MREKSVCFIGHRNINYTPELRERINQLIYKLIESGTVEFIFGDNSAFNDLCYDVVTELKEKYPEINRIHFRTSYENADEYTLRFLLAGYEKTICPKGVGSAGKASYIERNQAMMDESDICIFYYNEKYLPPKRKYAEAAFTDQQPNSGTAIAYAYAVKKKKKIINTYLAP